MLVNTARALKYLESYGQRQSQLFTVLEKYHQVCDGLEDLKSQFSFPKEATSRNIENLQQAITVQQTYTYKFVWSRQCHSFKNYKIRK